MAKKSTKPTSKSLRVEQSQTIHDINYQMEEAAAIKTIEESISAVFGVPKVGKTKFAYEMGIALQKKYSLPHSGVFFLQCDWLNYEWKVRGTKIRTWLTFCEFIDGLEERPAFVDSVKMFVVDTLDSLIPMGMNKTCYDLNSKVDKEISDLKDAATKIGDKWCQDGWIEFRKELEYQLLRLANFGPGVLILSHESYKDVRVGGMMGERAQMALSKSVYNTVVPACSMVLRMKLKEGEAGGGVRHLIGLESNEERAGDNLNKIAPRYPRGIIPFTTEAEAVEKLLDCFGSDVPIIKKKKKAKKKVKKVNKKTN